MLDSERERKWKVPERSKYIVRPSAVEEVFLLKFLLKSNLVNEVYVHSPRKVLPGYKVENLPER